MQRFDNTAADLLPEILCRLPVKSLVRFKCVDKTWCRIIEDPKFIIKHFLFFKNDAYFTNDNNTSVQSTQRHLIVKYTRQLKSFVSLLSLRQDHVSLDLLDLPYNKYRFVHLQVLGPCNGLYYLYGSPSSLINPAMREIKILPDSDLCTDFLLSVPGFGFDPRTDDYKVVLLTLSPDFTPVTTWLAKVYSLNSNCWRQVYCPVLSSVAVHESQMNTFVNGAYHWLAYDTVEFSVIAFDMVNEAFRSIRFPILSYYTWETPDVTVTSFKNSLAVILFPANEIIKTFDIWVMTDYSDEGSWTKQLRFQPQIEIERPIGFLRSDDQLVLENKRAKVVLFDVNTNEIKELGIQGNFQVLEYEESLVSLRRKHEQYHADVSVFGICADPFYLSSSG